MSDYSNRASAFSVLWLLALIIGGLLASAAWEFYARGLSPNFFGVLDGQTVPPQAGFAAMVAGILGSDAIPGFQIFPDTLISAVAAQMAFDLPSESFAQFEIAGEVFNINAAVALHLLAGVIGLPLLYLLIVRPIFFFLPWFILGPLFGVLAFAIAGYLLNVVLLEQAPFFGLLGVEEAAAAGAGAPLTDVPAEVVASAATDGFDKGLSWLIGDVIYGLFLGLFVRIFAGD